MPYFPYEGRHQWTLRQGYHRWRKLPQLGKRRAMRQASFGQDEASSPLQGPMAQRRRNSSSRAHRASLFQDWRLRGHS